MTTDTDTDSDEPTDAESHVTHTDVGVTITSKIKRGTETRDQDEHTIKSKGETLDEAIEKHEGAIAWLEQRLAPQTRGIQPEAPAMDSEDGDDAGGESP